MTARRDIFIAAVDAAWRDFRGALEPLSAEDIGVPGVCGDWSVKDLVAHVAMWERIAIDGLRGSPPRRPETEAEMNSINLAGAALKLDLAAEDLLMELDETHRDLRDALTEAPDECFDRAAAFRPGLEADTVFHYADHGRQIRDWISSHRRRVP